MEEGDSSSRNAFSQRRTMICSSMEFVSVWRPKRGLRSAAAGTVIETKPMVVDRRQHWRSNSRGSQTTPLLRSLEAPDEHRQFAEWGAEFTGRRLLLQQDRPYRCELLVTGKALVVPRKRRRETALKWSFRIEDGAKRMLHPKNIVLVYCYC